MWRRIGACLFITVMIVTGRLSESSSAQVGPVDQGIHVQSMSVSDAAQPLYPNLLDSPPDIPSPYLTKDGREMVTALLIMRYSRLSNQILRSLRSCSVVVASSFFLLLFLSC